VPRRSVLQALGNLPPSPASPSSQASRFERGWRCLKKENAPRAFRSTSQIGRFSQPKKKSHHARYLRTKDKKEARPRPRGETRTAKSRDSVRGQTNGGVWLNGQHHRRQVARETCVSRCPIPCLRGGKACRFGRRTHPPIPANWCSSHEQRGSSTAPRWVGYQKGDSLLCSAVAAAVAGCRSAMWVVVNLGDPLLCTT